MNQLHTYPLFFRFFSHIGYRVLNRVPCAVFPFPGGLPNPGIEPESPALQADSLPSEPPGKLYR